MLTVHLFIFFLNLINYLSCFFAKICDENGITRKIGYQKLDGMNPGIVFIPGFMGTKDHLKPAVIMNFCLEQGIQFIR